MLNQLKINNDLKKRIAALEHALRDACCHVCDGYDYRDCGIANVMECPHKPKFENEKTIEGSASKPWG